MSTNDVLSKLKAEIERRITDNTFGAKLELIDILAWLDSLQQEQPSEDLKGGIKEWVNLMVGASFPEQDGDYISEEDYRSVIRQTALHFYELGKQSKEPVTEGLEKAAEEEVIIERAKDLYPKLLPFATYICGYAFHDNDGVPKETIQKYLSIGAEWRDAQIPKLPDDVGEAADYYEKHRNPIADTEPEECRKNFIAGAKWQAEQLLKGSPMPEDTVIFQKGIEEGKRLMMEDAVEGFIFQTADYYPKELIARYDGELGMGDKVKIVIVKEDKK